MAFAENFRRQVDLLLRLIPAGAEETCFALKGGTAINLFVRDLPRLSVDIDLTYLPVQDRGASLQGVEEALRRIARRIEAATPGAHVAESRTPEEVRVTRLLVRSGAAQVKIEVTPVLRGCVFPPQRRAVSDRVSDEFGFAEMPLVSFADLFAGKLVAALDRQHPRDLFDVRELLATEGITDDLRRAFLVYLVSHDRRMSEIIAPRRKDIKAEFERGFAGMTAEPVVLADLLDAREALLAEIVGNMPDAHRRFLVDLKATGEADWKGLGLVAARDLPAVRWRLHNLSQLERTRRAVMARRLAESLGIAIGEANSD